jgi:hypothetical protein
MFLSRIRALLEGTFYRRSNFGWNEWILMNFACWCFHLLFLGTWRGVGFCRRLLKFTVVLEKSNFIQECNYLREVKFIPFFIDFLPTLGLRRAMNIFQVFFNIFFLNDPRCDDLCNLINGNGLVMELICSFQRGKFLFDRSDIFADFVHQNCKGN